MDYFIVMYGKRIRELREEKGLSQLQLGKVFAISQTTIGKYEREEVEPNIETIKAICWYFNVSADYLLGLEDETGAKIK